MLNQSGIKGCLVKMIFPLVGKITILAINKVQQNRIYFCNDVKFFTVTFDQLKVSLLNNCCYNLFLKNLTVSKLLNSSVYMNVITTLKK